MSTAATICFQSVREPIVEPMMLSWFQKTSRISSAGFGPDVAPQVTIRPPLAAALSDGEKYGFTTREGAYGDLIYALERSGAGLVDRSGDVLRPTFDDPSVAAALERYADRSRRMALMAM